MDQQDQQKHVCRYCDRVFTCGQSLGGHMRSHVVNLVTSDDDDVAKITNAEEDVDTSKLNFQQNNTINTSYGLRENPKKSNRFTRSGEEEVLSDENLCKLCGKGFQSSKALFGHMKCHSEKLIVNTEDLSSHSDGNDEPDASLHCSRRRSMRMVSNKTSYTSDNEQEDVAKSLMMLSNDNWGSKELCSDEDIILATPNGNGGKRHGKEICSDEIYSCKKTVYDDADELGFNRRASKKNKFQCITCKKIFHSYQALGGHRASHKKIKGCYASKFNQVLENSSEQADHFATKKPESNLAITENREMDDLTNERLKKGKSKEHECPFCFKIFSSGQALGGHKRSHLLNSSAINSNQSIVIQAPTTINHDQDLLDLNLPAPTDDDDTPSKVAGCRVNQWWGMKDCTKPESHIGFSL